MTICGCYYCTGIGDKTPYYGPVVANPNTMVWPYSTATETSRILVCPHCKHDSFYLTMMIRDDILNIICRGCGKIFTTVRVEQQ